MHIEKDKMIEVASNFLVGEGPFITIISAFDSQASLADNLIRNKELRSFAEENMDARYLFDCCMGGDFNVKYIAISGLRETQAAFIADKFQQEKFIFKDWNGDVFIKRKNHHWFSEGEMIKHRGLSYLFKIDDPAIVKQNSGDKIISFDFKM